MGLFAKEEMKILKNPPQQLQLRSASTFTRLLGNFSLLCQLPLDSVLKADQELLGGRRLAVVAEQSKGQKGSLNKRRSIIVNVSRQTFLRARPESFAF